MTAVTARQPDVLSDGVASLTLRRGILFSGPVASFSDTNPTTSASQFVAKINWGDGQSSLATVTGAAGSFVVDASHSYARNGRYTISVSVTMAGPVSAGTNGTGTVVVTNPPRARPACPGHSPRGQEAREAGEKAAQLERSPASGS